MRPDQVTFFRLNVFPMPQDIESRIKIHNAAIAFAETLQEFMEAATVIIEYSPGTGDPHLNSALAELEHCGVYKGIGVIPRFPRTEAGSQLPGDTTSTT